MNRFGAIAVAVCTIIIFSLVLMPFANAAFNQASPLNQIIPSGLSCIFRDNFEEGSFNTTLWNITLANGYFHEAAPSLESTIALGNYAANITGSNWGGNGSLAYGDDPWVNFTSTPTDVWAEQWVYVPACPSHEEIVHLATLTTSLQMDSAMLAVQLNSDDTISRWTYPLGDNVKIDNYSFPLNCWMRITLHCNVSDTSDSSTANGEYEIWMNNTEIYKATNVDNYGEFIGTYETYVESATPEPMWYAFDNVSVYIGTGSSIGPSPSPTPTPSPTPAPAPTPTHTPTPSSTPSSSSTSSASPPAPTPTPSQTPTSTPTVPEFPSPILLITFLVIATLLGTVMLKRKQFGRRSDAC